MKSSITINEFCDPKKANWLISNIDLIPIRKCDDENYDPKANIITYCKQILKSKCGIVKRVYKNNSGKGRMFLNNGQNGYQSMIREYRSILCSDDYYDIDMKNCQPSILEQFCMKNNINCYQLTNYNKNREKIFDKFATKNINKNMVKMEFISMMYGSSKSSILSEICNIDEFYTNIQHILSEVAKINKYWVDIALTKDKINVNGSSTAYLCQDIENNLLMLAIKFFKKNNFEIGALCFDGLMIRKTQDLSSSIILDLNKYITKNSEYKIEFVIKPFEKIIDIPKEELTYINDKYHVDNDAEGADIIISLLNKKLIKSNGRYFIKKFDNANIFIEDQSTGFKDSKDIMIKFISNCNILINSANGPRDYSKLSKGCNNICTMFFARMPIDDNFINKTWNSNLLKLCFLNGYYDFKTSIFKDYDDETFTTVYINRNYSDDVDELCIKKVYEIILDPIFSDKNQQNYILNWFARGIAGHYEEKTWSVGLGSRNSGKSVITDLFKNTFNSYVGTFNAEEMSSIRVGNGDIAKKLAWCIPFQFRRLNFSNELKTEDDSGRKIKLDGNIIKSITSGGDEKTARLNFKDEIQFKIQSRMCLFMNEMIDISPQDACETLSIFVFPTIFKKIIDENDNKINNVEDSIYKIKKANDDIKNIIQDENIQNAFLHIILNHYSKNQMIKPTEIAENLAKYNDDSTGDDNILNNLFEFTLNKLDRIPLAQYNDIIRLNKLNKSKAQLILNKNGVVDLKSMSSRFKIGIKIKIDDIQ